MFCFFYIECSFKLKFFLFFFSPTCLGKKNILAFVKESLIYFNKFFLIIMKYNEWCSVRRQQGELSSQEVVLLPSSHASGKILHVA